MLKKSRDAFNRSKVNHEGRLAFRSGVALDLCPYTDTTLPQHAEWWRQGWRLEQEVVQMVRDRGQTTP